MIFDKSTYVFPKTENNNYHNPEERIAFISDRNSCVIEQLFSIRSDCEARNEYPSLTALAEMLASRINLKAVSVLKIVQRLDMTDNLQPSIKLNAGFIPVYISPTDIRRFHTAAWS